MMEGPTAAHLGRLFAQGEQYRLKRKKGRTRKATEGVMSRVRGYVEDLELVVEVVTLQEEELVRCL